MPVNINADTVVGGAVVTADASGVLALQAAGSTQVTVNTSGVTLANALPAGSGGTGRTTLTANNVLLGNGTSAVNFVAPGTNGNVLTSNGTTWTSSAAPSNFPLTLVSTTTITSSTSSYSATNLQAYRDYVLYIYFLNVTQGNPDFLINISTGGTVGSTGSAGTRYFMPNFGTSGMTSGGDTSNRIWTNSGNIMVLSMAMYGFGEQNFFWQSTYNSALQNSLYGGQFGRADAGAGNTCTGFSLTFPSAATTGIIQLYRRG